MLRISTRTHGVIDYVTGLALMAVPPMLGMSKKATALLTGSGAMAVGYSLLTNYEMGAAKVLPMKVHLGMDAMSGLGLIAAGAMMEDEDDCTRNTLMAVGAFELLVTAMSETRSPTERARRATRVDTETLRRAQEMTGRARENETRRDVQDAGAMDALEANPT